MSLVRIIPRLDIKGPNVVKGLCFDGYRVLRHPETFAQTYYNEGADELFFGYVRYNYWKKKLHKVKDKIIFYIRRKHYHIRVWICLNFRE